MTDPTPPSQPEPAPAPRKRPWVMVVRVAVVALALVALYLCVAALVESWPTVSSALQRASIPLLVLALLAGAAGSVGLAFAWQRTLRLLEGRTRPFGKVVAWFFAGELGKYLPGSVWAVVGRGELAHRGGVGRGNAYSATLLSMVLMIIGAGLVGAVLVPFLSGAALGGWEWLVMAAIPAAIVLMVPAINGRLFALLGKVTRGRVAVPPVAPGRMADLIASSVPAWMLTSGASVLVTAALGFEQNPAQVAFAALLAWLGGFLAIPVPAGVGVREGLFVLLSGLEPGVAVAVAALARVLLIASDAVGGIWGLAVVGREKRNNTVILP